MNDFREKKWERAFYFFFDVDRSGIIDWNDFDVLITRFEKLHGGKKGKLSEAARGSLKRVWDDIRASADVNDDGQVTVEEWKEMWRRAATDCCNSATTNRWQKDFIDFLFNLFDVSGDNGIDQTEYSEVMQSYGLSKPETVSAFTAMCKGESASIDYDSFLRLWRQYFFSSDATDPGNHLFGSIQL